MGALIAEGPSDQAQMVKSYAVLWAALQIGGGPGETPRGITHAVEAALAGDGVEQVSAEWTRRLARDATDRAAAFGLATVARLTYDYPEAERRYGALIDPDRGQSDVYTVHALIGIGTSFRTQGLLLDAEEWFDRAVAAAQATRDTSAAVEAAIGLGAVRSRSASPARALAHLDSVAPFVPTDDLWLRAHHQCRRAAILVLLGQPEARADARAGAELARAADAPRTEAACRLVVAQDFVRVGLMDSAGPILWSVSKQQAALGDRAGSATSAQWLGYVSYTVGKYGDAWRQAHYAVREGETSGNLAALAWASMNLASMAVNLSDFHAGSGYVARAQELLARTGDEWGRATARDIDAAIKLESGDLEGARAVYDEILDWANERGQFNAIVNAHASLATIHVREGDWDDAQESLVESQRISRQYGMTEWLRGGDYRLAALALWRGQLDSAQIRLRSYVDALNPDQHGYRYRARLLQARLFQRLGRLDAALDEFRAATDALERWRTSLSGSEQRVLAFQWRDFLGRGELGEAELLAEIAASGEIEAAFELAERRRARELRHQILLDQMISTFAGNEDAPAMPEAAPVPAASDIVKAIPDQHTALLEYVTGPGRQPTTLFVVTSAGLTAHALAPIDSMAPDILRFTALVESGDPQSDIAARLARQLFEPALDDLAADITRLIVVPDGVLHRLPFDALVLPDGKFVVERYAVSLVPSIAIATDLWRLPKPTGEVGILALGDPDFDAGGGSDSASALAYRAAYEARGGLPRVRQSGREAKRVARYASIRTVRLRGDASEAYLKSNPLYPYRIIHLATHAMVDEWSVARTSLALAPGEGEDGFLGPSDLASLRLNADVVVLSACRTAGGVLVGGEGVRGLAAPLLQAGAHSVVATGWEIGDRSTRRFIEDFYDGLADEQPAGDALRSAKLAAIERGASIGEWAAFTLMGDPFVRVPLSKPPWWAFWR